MSAMTTIFTRIIDGELPGTFVLKDDDCVAFLSINPTAPGHTLVVPRAEVDHWIDLPEELACHLLAVARRIGRAQQQAFGAGRIGLLVAGFEVPHTHLHVIPMASMQDLDLANAAPTTPEELEEAATRIRAVLGSSGL
jgi:histidine triad (HIT) family protein